MVSKKVVIVAIVAISSLLSNYVLYQQIQSLNQTVEVYKKQNSELLEKLALASTQSPTESTTSDQSQIVQNNETVPKSNAKVSESSESITAVAVRPVLLRDGFFENVRYEGTVMKITVDIRDGKGLVLVNTETPTGVDFQTSAKTAVKVAQEYTGVDLSEKDIIFSITSDKNEELQAVDGPSAGAAMAILLASEIQGKSVDEKVLMTGTIESDGNIGRVGGVAEKADAAGIYGAKIFLVPNGQAITHVESCKESRNGPFIYKSCTLEEKPLSPMMEEKYGLKVIEVKNLEAALNYFK